MDKTKDLASYFGINIQDYKNIKLSVFNFSNKVINLFMAHNVKTLEDLLRLSWADIYDWKGFGSGSGWEIEKNIKKFLEDEKRGIKTGEDSYADRYQLNASDFRSINIQELPFSAGIINTFFANKIRTVEDMLLLSCRDISAWNGFGPTSITKIEKVIYSLSKNDVILEKIKENKTLSLYYGVGPDCFMNKSIHSLGLPQKIAMPLMSNGINTINELLLLSWEEIDKIAGFGKTSKEWFKKYLSSYFDRERKRIDSELKFKEELRTAFVERRILEIDEGIHLSSQEEVRNHYNSAVSVLGKDIIDSLLSDVNYCKYLSDCLPKEADLLRSNYITKELLDVIPTNLIKMKSRDLFSFYSSDTDFLCSLLDENENDVPFDELLHSKSKEWFFVSFYHDFYKWLHTDYKRAYIQFIKKEDKKAIDILMSRAKGITLEDVGITYSVSRERIRQLEARGLSEVGRFIEKKRIPQFIRIIFYEKGYATMTELETYFGEYSSILVYYFMKHPHNNLYYHRSLELLMVTDKREKEYD